MKLILNIVFCLIMAFAPLSVLGASSGSGSVPTKHLSLKGSNIPRPRDDGWEENVVECTVENNWVSITFERSEGLGTLILKDGGVDVISTSMCDTSSEIRFPLLHTGNPLLIIIRTSEGNEYEGWIE